jgi:hypothetical protein
MCEDEPETPFKLTNIIDDDISVFHGGKYKNGCLLG